MPTSDPILIVGIPSTIRSVWSQLDALGAGRPEVLGFVLADAGDAGLGVNPPAPILGSIDDLPDLVRHFNAKTALVSLPAAMTGAIDRVRGMLSGLGVRERFLPTAADVLNDTAHQPWRTGRLDFAELIGRPAHPLDDSRVRGLLRGKRVLITGAGGSIGSELARLCAAAEPECVILMERAENALFEIDRQIGAAYPRVGRKAVLHDVVDAEGTLRRLVSLRPQVVFHAAAHKHVPMMEDHPAAAVNNNIFGTKSVADAALAVGVERFVMVSTDKAVNPSSVMGATKRLAELYVRSLNGPSGGTGGAARFCLVRFGNVLGSACSVLPIWSRQIAEGGPITVTHPEMTRYFMTIPEAAGLVIQSATIDGAGDVFVLDMGKPVRIAELADRFVRAHGLEPSWDRKDGPQTQPASSASTIRMTFTGARPGEKLHEELVYAAEELRDTPIPGVLSWRGSASESSRIAGMIADMSAVRNAEAPSVVLSALMAHVPEMRRQVHAPIPHQAAA